MIAKILKRLNEPFPEHTRSQYDFFAGLCIALFVTLFLYFFKPFGMHNVGENVFWYCAGFGLVTFVFGYLWRIIWFQALKLRTDVPTWTLWKWIVHSVAAVCWIALGNLLYMNLLYPGEYLNWASMGRMLQYTLMLGFFPVVFSGLYIQLQATKLHRREASAIATPRDASEQSQAHTFDLSHGQELRVTSRNLRFVEAMQNYVVVHFVEDNEHRHEVVRNTIKSVAEQLSDASILRCHRSFLVNVNSVKQVTGNAQGLKLALRDLDEQVPVSRTYISRFKQALAHAE